MEYIHRLAEEIGERGFERAACLEDKETIRQLLKRFMGEPSRAEAEVFGSLPFSDDVLEGGGAAVASAPDREGVDSQSSAPQTPCHVRPPGRVYPGERVV